MYLIKSRMTKVYYFILILIFYNFIQLTKDIVIIHIPQKGLSITVNLINYENLQIFSKKK